MIHSLHDPLATIMSVCYMYVVMYLLTSMYINKHLFQGPSQANKVIKSLIRSHIFALISHPLFICTMYLTKAKTNNLVF